ncbi:DUF4312 family protein [Serratia sp. NPDC078593]|uniref:DUF4312 family protein n=1 Tax=unclassified Serratia (in: enterobacteria) TaxID=2647522 RepID=UPI0037CDCFB7
MKESYTTSVTVAGKGDSKAKAFASALANVQGAVLKSTNNILLRIEPQDISVLKAEEKITRERFLFFFLPRERKSYAVSLEVTVNVIIINTEQVVFTSK